MNSLRILYIVPLGMAILAYLAFNFILPEYVGPLAGDEAYANVQYAAEVVTILLTIIFVYLSTRLMTLPKVQKSIAGDETKYLRWAQLRWLMLTVLLLLGLSVYFLFKSSSVAWTPVLVVLSFFFVWPTKQRREDEIAAAHKAYPVACP